MEKYGVDEDLEPAAKQASIGCPDCGMPPEKLQKSGGIVRCPNCGSRPFEPKDRPQR